MTSGLIAGWKKCLGHTQGTLPARSGLCIWCPWPRRKWSDRESLGPGICSQDPPRRPQAGNMRATLILKGSLSYTLLLLHPRGKGKVWPLRRTDYTPTLFEGTQDVDCTCVHQSARRWMGALPTENPAGQERGREAVTSLACSHREASPSRPPSLCASLCKLGFLPRLLSVSAAEPVKGVSTSPRV